MIDIHARAPGIALTPIIILRWMAFASQLLSIMGAEALFHITLPVKPLLLLVAASGLANVYAMVAHKRRQVPEETVSLHLIFDILQFTALLYFTGGTTNPFSILLLAPLAMAASLLSLFSLCLLIMITIVCATVLTFGAPPLAWPDPVPYFSPLYQHGLWVALILALIFITFINWRLAMEGRRINTALGETRAILEEKLRVSALGALAAAAVHELGSPLGTIALVTREMERETHPDDPFAEDIALLRTETEKCKKILADLARNPAKSTAEPERMRFDRLLMEIASAYADGDKKTDVQVHSRIPENLPFLFKTPNLEYGLGNLISNAVSFATSRVAIHVEGWQEDVEVTIYDNGPGFAPATLHALGQPYISTRESRQNHLGLGVFISINLLEATGGRLTFTNAPEGGALIRIRWPRTMLEAQAPSL